MVGTPSYAQLGPDGAGKKLRTYVVTVGGDDVHEEVVLLADKDGNLIDMTTTTICDGSVASQKLAIDANGKIGVSSLPNVTIGSMPSITIGTDSVGLAKEAGGNLAAVKTDVDHLDVNLSTRALEAGGNLATIAGKDFATQTTLAAVKAKTDLIANAVDTTNVTIISEKDGRTYKRATGSCNTNGNNTIVAAVANKVLKVYDYSLQAQGTVVCQFQDGAGGASIGQPWSFQAREGKNKHGVPAGAPHDFATSASTLLNLNLTAGVTVGYEVIYTDSDAS